MGLCHFASNFKLDVGSNTSTLSSGANCLSWVRLLFRHCWCAWACSKALKSMTNWTLFLLLLISSSLTVTQIVKTLRRPEVLASQGIIEGRAIYPNYDYPRALSYLCTHWCKLMWSLITNGKPCTPATDKKMSHTQQQMCCLSCVWRPWSKPIKW